MIDSSRAGLLLMERPYPVANEGGAGGPVSFSDDFDRANGTLGSNWTVYAGDWAIASNAAVPQSASFAKNLAIFNTDTGSVNQWARITYDANGTFGFLGPVFRFTDEDSEHYECDYMASECYFTYSEDVAYTASAGDNIINGTTTPSWPGINFSATIVGTTIEGTGDNTVIRFWFWAADDPPEELEPSAPDLWDGDAAFIEVTTNPARSADTGTKIGICGFFNPTSARLIAFAGGGF